jgi:acetyl esterase
MNLFLRKFYVFVLLVSIGSITFAQKAERPTPDLANVVYGTHERNVFDIWFADKTKITPLVVYIHGGGFMGGSKENLKAETLNKFLEEGISVASINYRFIKHAPLPAAHYDARRALQFIRSKATEWKIDKNRIGAFGGSAGAQICMWLAFSDDMAKPSSNEALKKESTRLLCVATNGGQTTIDLDLWVEWIPGYDEPHVDPLAKSDAKTMEEYKRRAGKLSAISLVTADDPPIFMTYGMAPDASMPTNPKKAQGWLIHHVNFGVKLKEKMDKIGIEAELKYPGTNTKYSSNVEFFKSKLF